jgi:hypothetical protein
MIPLGLVILAIWLLSSCGYYSQCYPEANYPNRTSFPSVTGVSPEDMLVLRKVEACLNPLRYQWLSPEEQKEAQCVGSPTFVIRSCLAVAVAPTWHTSMCSGEQVFPCNVDDISCEEKGLHPTWLCPCSCRAIIQDDTVIWVTPNRKLLPAYAVTLLTGCNRPWTEHLAPCSSPNLVNQ